MYASLTTSNDLFAGLEQFQDRLNELLGTPGASSSIRAVGRDGRFPALNVGTWAEALEVYAFAPGIDPASLEVTVEKGLLTLAGERKTPAAEHSTYSNVYANDRFSGRFRRVVELPDDSDATRVEASYRNGVLKFVIPKRESAKPRRIEVSGSH
jgi:HSP20 family protein